MKILLTGATGFVGSALLPMLQGKGHQLTVLSRSATPGDANGVHYVRQCGDLHGAVDAVINLAGASLAGKRWNASYKAEIVASRVELTQTLGEYFRNEGYSPAIWINASAIGYYGPRGDEALDESAVSGEGFSAQLCRDWEASALEAAGSARVCLMRLGVVLDKDGGAYAQMAPPFRMGVANWIGHGKQWLSWIHRTDVARAFCFAVENDALTGPVNVTAPTPVTSREFCDAMRRVHRTLLAIPMPAPVMRAMVGEMADELLLTGQRVVPAHLLNAGFEFTYPGVDVALSQIEGK